jgi:hypothetical protein
MPWVTERIPCPQCFGGWTKCSSCFGSGYYYEPCASCPGGKECSFCNGRGTQTCSRCSGLCSIMQEVWHDDPPTSAPSATQLPTTHWKTPASRDIAPPRRPRPPGDELEMYVRLSPAIPFVWGIIIGIQSQPRLGPISSGEVAFARIIHLIGAIIGWINSSLGLPDSSWLLIAAKIVIYVATIPYDIAVVIGAVCGNIGLTIYNRI